MFFTDKIPSQCFNMSFDVSEQKTISSINDFISKVEYSYYFKHVGLILQLFLEHHESKTDGVWM